MPAALIRGCLFVAVLLLAGCAGRHVESPSPFATSGFSTAGGYPVSVGGPSGTTIRFIDHGRFGIGIVLRNRSSRPVTVLDVRTPEPPGSLVHQVGVRLVPWNPRPCPTNQLGCPIAVFLQSSYGAVQPTALTVEPGKSVGVQLNYVLGRCGGVRLGTTASASDLQVVFRYGDGPSRTEQVPVGAAQLRLRKPAGVECLSRPYSRIGLVGSFTTSPGHGTIPGSDGDTCKTDVSGEIVFRSRQFFDRSGIAFRVEIRLGRFIRPLPRRASVKATSAQVLVTGGFGLHGWTSFRDSRPAVTVHRAAASTLSGRFDARLAGKRRLFRAYGHWRCAVLPR